MLQVLGSSRWRVGGREQDSDSPFTPVAQSASDHRVRLPSLLTPALRGTATPSGRAWC